MFRSRQDPGQIQQVQRRVKQIQLKQIGSEAIIKIPERNISVTHMVDDRLIVHHILLHGIGTDIIKHK